VRKLPLLTGTLIFLAYLSALASAFAHEHWIDLENFHPGKGEKAKIFICSGHYFPKSSATLSERVLHTTMVKPDGEIIAYTTIEEKNRRAGELIFESTGAYIIRFFLKKPQLKEPLYWASSIVIVEAENEDTGFYSLGNGLEIVPQKKISDLRKGDTLPLILLYDGKRVGSTLSVSPEDGKSYFMRTKKTRPALIKIEGRGKYLIRAKHKGKACSLTFSIRELDEKT
jgi:uncharacterized GH25 family protein